MSPRQVVIGSGPDALRAAAALARAGHSVHLIQQADCASGLRHPDLPLGTGLIHVSSDYRALTEAVLGPLVEGPDPSRAVVINNQVESLPVGVRGLHRMLPGSVLRGVGKSLVRARGRNLMAEIIGGGMEERSHRDWVIRRMGEPAWHHLYQSYALRRWGLPSHELAASVARVHHGAVDEGSVQVVGGSYSQALENAAKCLADAGGTIQTGKNVEKLELRDGRVRVIHVEGDESIEVDGRVWVCDAPERVVQWLGDSVPKGIRVHASRCRQFPVVRVGLRGETRDLPTEIHVLDERASFWRVTSPYGIENTAIFHLTDRPDRPLPTDDAELAREVAREANEVGLSGFRGEDARVERVAVWQPVWGIAAHAWIRSVLLHWNQIGLVGVGRGGAMAALDPGEEIGMVARLAEHDETDQLEIHRVCAYPPVEALTLDASISSFVRR